MKKYFKKYLEKECILKLLKEAIIQLNFCLMKSNLQMICQKYFELLHQVLFLKFLIFWIQDKHDSIVREIYNLIGRLSKYFEEENFVFIFEQLSEISTNQYNEQIIKLITQITQSQFHLLKKQSFSISNLIENQEIENNKQKVIGFQLLWKSMLDEAQLPKQLQDLSIKNINDLINQIIFEDIIKKCTIQCCENIKNNTSVAQSLIILYGLCMKKQSINLFNEFNNKYNFFEMLLQDLNKNPPSQYSTVKNSILARLQLFQLIQSHSDYRDSGKIVELLSLIHI
eukprot:TRINITY_DN17242_c0_g2_i1.p1 TRINITY_DN17242_c0_g2~~TRINITY_DN17242_c0_g2_i1.p1  ORF type:complete len:284 (-),score=34.48 TRINITY_DN17242_c0_g2_i1:127-978(-)